MAYKVTCNLTQKYFYLDLRDDRINVGLNTNVDMSLRYDGNTQSFYYNNNQDNNYHQLSNGQLINYR